MFVRSLTRRIGTWQLFIQQRMPLRIERLSSRRPTEHVFYYVKIRSSTFFLFLHCYFKRHAQACNSGINFTVGNITLAKHLIPTSTNRVSKIAMCRKTEKKTFNLLEFYFIVISNFKSDEHEKIFLLYKGLFPAADNDPKQTSILARWWV